METLGLIIRSTPSGILHSWLSRLRLFKHPTFLSFSHTPPLPSFLLSLLNHSTGRLTTNTNPNPNNSFLPVRYSPARKPSPGAWINLCYRYYSCQLPLPQISPIKTSPEIICAQLSHVHPLTSAPDFPILRSFRNLSITRGGLNFDRCYPIALLLDNIIELFPPSDLRIVRLGVYFESSR